MSRRQNLPAWLNRPSPDAESSSSSKELHSSQDITQPVEALQNPYATPKPRQRTVDVIESPSTSLSAPLGDEIIENDAPSETQHIWCTSRCAALEKRIQQLESERQQQEQQIASLEQVEEVMRDICATVHEACVQSGKDGLPEQDEVTGEMIADAIRDLAQDGSAERTTHARATAEAARHAADLADLVELFRYFAQMMYQHLSALQPPDSNLDLADSDVPAGGRLLTLDESNKEAWAHKEDCLLWAVLEHVLAGKESSLAVFRPRLEGILARVGKLGLFDKTLRKQLLQAHKKDSERRDG